MVILEIIIVCDGWYYRIFNCAACAFVSSRFPVLYYCGGDDNSNYNQDLCFW